MPQYSIKFLLLLSTQKSLQVIVQKRERQRENKVRPCVNKREKARRGVLKIAQSLILFLFVYV